MYDVLKALFSHFQNNVYFKEMYNVVNACFLSLNSHELYELINKFTKFTSCQDFMSYDFCQHCLYKSHAPVNFHSH